MICDRCRRRFDEEAMHVMEDANLCFLCWHILYETPALLSRDDQPKTNEDFIAEAMYPYMESGQQ